MTAAQATIKPSESFQYNTNAIYWNDFPEVRAHLNQVSSGHSTTDWMALLDHYPPAARLLSLNCGNGWVERDLFKRGHVRSVVGLDANQVLVDEARHFAVHAGIPCDYRTADADTVSLTGLGFDYVLNHATLQRVAYIDRLVREILINIPEHGLFINYAYVGPHRNQYASDAWSRMVELWEQLPPQLRDNLRYPNLDALIEIDPGDALHSELVVGTLRRYFDIVELRPLGGAIAYQLLWNNAGLFRARDSQHGAYWLSRIIEADVAYTDGKLENCLFAILICRPRKAVLRDVEQLARWTNEENAREEQARRNGGRYYPHTTLELINRKP
jgi:hypothetical protein